MTNIIELLRSKNLTAAEYILREARKCDTRITSLKTAKRVLNENRLGPLPRLVCLGTQSFRTTPTIDALLTNDARNNRLSRVQAVACKLANIVLNSPAPEVTLQELCRQMTPDILPAAIDAMYRLMAGKFATKMKSKQWPYRRATSSWAGGGHYVCVTVGDAPSVTAGSEKVWSSNGKWSGHDSYANLTITRRAFEAFGVNLVIGGLITIDCEQIAPREYRATWVEQGRGFGLKTVSGYIIRGRHITASSIERAREQAYALRAKAASALRTNRCKLLPSELSGLMVTREDSIDGGNCNAGTSSFIKTFDIVIGSRTCIPARELLAMRDDIYTRRAVQAAVLRKVKESTAQTATA